MLRGLYSAASGMVASMVETDVIANNLANADSPGFQPDRVVYSSFKDELYSRLNDPLSLPTSAVEVQQRPSVGQAGNGVLVEGVHTVYRQGKLERTENTLDLGLEGEGFFAIQTAAGARFTRNGSFTMNNEGYLTTLSGEKVLGQRYFDEPLSPIKLPPGKQLEIDEEGKIMVDKEIVGQLAVRDFPKPYNLSKVGQDQFAFSGEGERGKSFKVQQGWLEKPDVSIVEEMVNMISAMRVYEANSRAISANDQTLTKAVGEVGRYTG